ncbi:MAG: hypothetical protein Alpg2KO_24980 [Alphaproteobacteria bacterium]
MAGTLNSKHFPLTLLEMKRGDSFQRTVRIKDGDGALVDLTGFTCRFIIMDNWTDLNTLMELTETDPEIVMGGATGEMDISLTPNQTDDLSAGTLQYDWLTKDYPYELTTTDSSGVTKTRLIEKGSKGNTGDASAAAIPSGVMMDFAGASAPTVYLLCDGSAVSRSTYSDLFAAIGTQWGSGDGSTTFNLPDIRGRVAIGSGAGSGLTARTLAQTLGEEEHTLTEAELPSHDHTSYGQVTGRASGSSNLRGMSSAGTSNIQTSETGGDDSHNNMQPSAVVTKIIKT